LSSLLALLDEIQGISTIAVDQRARNWDAIAIDAACSSARATYLDEVRSRHEEFLRARSGTHATEPSRPWVVVERQHVFPPRQQHLASIDIDWHLHHRSAGSSQVLALSLLHPLLHEGSDLSWLRSFGPSAADVERSSFEVALDSSTLNEHPYSTSLDALVQTSDAVLAVEAKFTEQGFGRCRCRHANRGVCDERVLDRPYWRTAEALGLSREDGRCDLATWYQAIRCSAAARALATDGRRAIFLLFYDARNPHFTGSGSWPGWARMLRAVGQLDNSVEIDCISWQRLLSSAPVEGSVVRWCRDKHGITPAIPRPPLTAAYQRISGTAERVGGEGRALNQKSQLDLGERLLSDPTILSKAFAEGVDAIEWLHRSSPIVPPGFRLRATHPDRYDTASFAEEVQANPELLSFDQGRLRLSFVAREVPLLNLPGDARFEAFDLGPPTDLTGRSASTADLLLAAENGTPTFAEVKIGADATPLYALIQVLALAAEGSSASQRARLAAQPEFALWDCDRLDLALIALEPPEGGLFLPRLKTLTEELARKLVAQPAIATAIRRIVFIERASPDRRLSVKLEVVAPTIV
jgi:hypothetical protein